MTIMTNSAAIGFSIFGLVTGFLAMSLIIMQINSDDQTIALHYTMQAKNRSLNLENWPLSYF